MQRITCCYMIVFLVFGLITLRCSSEERESSRQQQEIAGTLKNSEQDAPKLEIISPNEGATVAMTELVRGTVSTPKLNVYVLIHPLTTNLWWVQNIPTVGPDGKWQSFCYFGAEKLGIGEPYEIIAVATSKKGVYKPGDTLEIVPSDLLRSRIITVRRAK
ncbi:MAG: hypothetical protein D4R73_02155 [Deltaproteobacteria bacterium]|nr:MAG: hypothetical protein D4R73_02155 [Deltaproteobacteria bacterium]